MKIITKSNIFEVKHNKYSKLGNGTFEGEIRSA